MAQEYTNTRSFKKSYARFQKVAKKIKEPVTRVIDEASVDIAKKHGV